MKLQITEPRSHIFSSVKSWRRLVDKYGQSALNNVCIDVIEGNDIEREMVSIFSDNLESPAHMFKCAKFNDEDILIICFQMVVFNEKFEDAVKGIRNWTVDYRSPSEVSEQTARDIYNMPDIIVNNIDHDKLYRCFLDNDNFHSFSFVDKSVTLFYIDSSVLDQYID